MRDEPLEKLSVKELKDLQSAVDRHIAARQAGERNALREQFRQLAEASGFTLPEILGGAKSGKGKPVAAKFANPDTPGETWSGRGRQPRWLVAKLKSGASRSDFLIR